MLIMETTRLTSKGQVVIPKVIRESLQIRPCTEFKVTSDGTRIVLETVIRKTHRLSDWQGFRRKLEPLSDAEAFAPVELTATE